MLRFIILTMALLTSNAYANTDLVSSYIRSVNAHTPSTLIAKSIVKWSTFYGIPLSLSVALAESESTFKVDAYNKGNYGLYQINRVHLRGISNAYLVDFNVQKGLYIFKSNMHGNVRSALLRYNGGGNKRYPDKVLAKQRKFELYARYF